MVQQYVAIDIPGKILYEKDFNVSIRKITPIEQKYIMSLAQKEQKSNKDYVNFIKKLISFDNPEMTFEQLFWFDVQYILYRIRFTTYPKYPIKLTFKCRNEECKKEIIYSLDMGKLDILTPDDLKDLTNIINLENLGEVKIRNKIMNDDIVIDDFIKKKGFDESDLQIRLLLLDLCLISNGKSLNEMYTMAEEGIITAEDIVAIEDWFSHAIWGVQEKVNVKCPDCGKEESRGYILALEDFFSAL